jgi:hypothetical protein
MKSSMAEIKGGHRQLLQEPALRLATKQTSPASGNGEYLNHLPG